MAKAIDHNITLRIIPMGSRTRRVGFDTFVSELQAIYVALVRADRLFSSGQTTTRYEIADLSMNSPARIVVAPLALDRKTDRRGRVLSGFVGGLQSIRAGQAPGEFDLPMLEKVREIAIGVSKRRVQTEITYQGQVVEINHIFERRITEILGRTEKVFTTIEGRMEALNLHAGSNLFAVYPLRGSAKVICHFPIELRARAKSAIDTFVIVSGTAEYGFKADYPRRMEVRDLELLDEQGGFPRLEELRGIARDATGDMDSAEFVEQVRDVWR